MNRKIERISGGERINAVKVGQKISMEDFIRLLEKEPGRIEISDSVFRQSKWMRQLFKALEAGWEKGPPGIVITGRGKEPKKIDFKTSRRFDPIDPFVRSHVGYRPEPQERLLIHLLEKKETPISELSPYEIELLPALGEQGHVEISKENLRVGLTELGATVARGAKKMYPEFWK